MGPNYVVSHHFSYQLTTESYSEPSQTSKIEVLQKWLSVFNRYFSKKLHLRRLIGF